jgi:hypothetical protein
VVLLTHYLLVHLQGFLKQRQSVFEVPRLHVTSRLNEMMVSLTFQVESIYASGIALSPPALKTGCHST